MKKRIGWMVLLACLAALTGCAHVGGKDKGYERVTFAKDAGTNGVYSVTQEFDPQGNVTKETVTFTGIAKFDRYNRNSMGAHGAFYEEALKGFTMTKTNHLGTVTTAGLEERGAKTSGLDELSGVVGELSTLLKNLKSPVPVNGEAGSAE